MFSFYLAAQSCYFNAHAHISIYIIMNEWKGKHFVSEREFQCIGVGKHTSREYINAMK